MAIFTYIATAIVTALEIGAAYAAFAKAVISTALAIATSRLINGPGARGGSGIQDQGVRVQLPPATENKIPIVYGRAFQQPIITDAKLSADRQKMTYTLVLSERTSTSTFTFNAVYWNDQKLNFATDGFTVESAVVQDTNGPTTATTLANLVKVYAFNGGSSSTYNVGIAGGTIPNVNAYDLLSTSTTYAMSDLVFAVVELTYDSTKGTTALPSMTFDISNSINNPGDVWVDYMTNSRYGAGLDVAYLDLDSVTGSTSTSLKSWSNQVPTNQFNNTGSTSTQTRYLINGILNTGDTVKNNIDRINLASSSWTTYDHKTGKWGVVMNRSATAGELAEAFVFDDDNIISDINLTSTNLEDLYNSVEVSYANHNARDQSDYYKASIPAAQRNNLEPNNTMRMRLDLVNNRIQAGRIGLIELNQSRYDLVIQFTADYSALVCEVGDVVKVTNPIYDFTEKLFRITRVRETESEEGGLAVEITALEYNAAVYTDDTQTDGEDKPNTNIPPITFIPAPNNLGLTLESAYTSYISFTAEIPTNSYPIEKVDIFYGISDQQLYPAPIGGTWTYLTSLINQNGLWQPGDLAVGGQVDVNIFDGTLYVFKANSFYKGLSSPDSATLETFASFGQVTSGDSDNIMVNTALPGYEYYMPFVEEIGTYTAVNARLEFKYITSSTTSSDYLYVPNVNLDNTLTWNTYVIPPPTGSTSTFLRNDGQWAIPPGGGGGGSTTWATLGNKTGASGPTSIALGQNANVNATRGISIGIQAGEVLPGMDGIAIGVLAGNYYQGEDGIAIGQGAGRNYQGIEAIAIGGTAQTNTSGSRTIAIGVAAGHTNQGDYAIALGEGAGFTNQGNYAIAIGRGAGVTSQPSNSIIINATSTYPFNASNANSFYVNPIRSSTATQILYYNTSTKEITYFDSTSIPETTTWATLGDKTGTNGPQQIALGRNAFSSLLGSAIAIGFQATATDYTFPSNQGAIAIGTLSDAEDSGVAIGYYANAETSSVSLGTYAGREGGLRNTFVGQYAGRILNTNDRTAVGFFAGNSNMSQQSSALGAYAGQSSLGQNSVVLGYQAGNSSGGTGIIAIGSEAGKNSAGNYSINIGYRTGPNSAPANTISLNASGVYFTATTTSSFYVNPIRSSTDTQILYYNPTSKEITYGLAQAIGTDQALFTTSSVKFYNITATNVLYVGTQSDVYIQSAPQFGFASLQTDLSNLIISSNAGGGGTITFGTGDDLAVSGSIKSDSLVFKNASGSGNLMTVAVNTITHHVPTVATTVTLNTLIFSGDGIPISSRASLIGPQGPSGPTGPTGPTGPSGPAGSGGAATVYSHGNVSGTITPDINSGTIHRMTLVGNITINSITNITTGSQMLIIMTQDATTGTRTLSSTMKFAGNNRVLTSTTASTDIVSVLYDGTTYWASLNKGFV